MADETKVNDALLVRAFQSALGKGGFKKKTKVEDQLRRKVLSAKHNKDLDESEKLALERKLQDLSNVEEKRRDKVKTKNRRRNKLARKARKK